MNVVPFPVLTMSSIVPRDWEPVLTLPLPYRPSVRLLEAARGQVLLYLDWVMNEMVLVETPPAVRREIIRASVRLAEIAEALPDAMEALAERRLLNQVDEQDLLRILNWANQQDFSDGSHALVERVLIELDARVAE